MLDLTLASPVVPAGIVFRVLGPLQVDGPRETVRIPPGHRRLAFAYTGLSLSAPERVRYRYRLDGFDNDWSEATTSREAVYTNLRPGPYRFRVVASNSDGLWSGRETSLGINIEPMLWQRRSFQAAGVIGGLAIAVGLYRLRLRQVAKQLNLRFEERLAERTRIAR